MNPDVDTLDLERCPASGKLLPSRLPESDFPLNWTTLCQECNGIRSLTRKRWNEHTRLKATSGQGRLL